jgi:hypothetical protein
MERSPREYYSRQGPLTDPRDEAAQFDGLPHDAAQLRDAVQGLIVHVFWAQRYGLSVPESRMGELQLRSIPEKLRRLRELDDRPITQSRPPERRLLGNCRDFSVVLCSMLRQRGVPARARCGFATYFLPNHFEDHWVCERLDASGRWVMVDAQLDALQRERLAIDFDPLDVPPDRFLVGGRAWQMCRSGKADPVAFGIMDMHGLWFVRGNLVRDIASLNKVELLPWDAWGLIGKDEKLITEEDMQLLDRGAELSVAAGDRFREVRSLYLGSKAFRVPPVIQSYRESGPQAVEIGKQFPLE